MKQTMKSCQEMMLRELTMDIEGVAREYMTWEEALPGTDKASKEH